MTWWPRVIVCGGGVTGLATAWHLQRAGARVTVLDAGETLGGVMQTTRTDGWLVEHGPNSCTLTPELDALLGALGLHGEVREAAPAAKRRYIVRNGVPLAVPGSPRAMLSSPLFSLGAKLRVLREPFIARRTARDDESVADFITRRLGAEPLAYAVDPFVSGVYAGDPATLSVRHAFPRLAELEREHGSLIRGGIALVRQARAAAKVPGARPRRHTMISFAEGLGTLPRALAASLEASTVRRGAHVTNIRVHEGRCSVRMVQDGLEEVLHADAVVSTLPLHALVALDLPLPVAAHCATLAAIRYPAVSSLSLGFRRADVAHPLDGFGMLVPSAERRHTLGVLFSSTLFEGRAPDGHVLLTCFTGGTRHPALGTAPVSQLLPLVLPELRQLLGVTGDPVFVEQHVWPRAIPQYEVGHDAASLAAFAIEAAMPGLVVDGQFRRGVSVGDCVAAGAGIATRAMAVAKARQPGTVVHG